MNRPDDTKAPETPLEPRQKSRQEPQLETRQESLQEPQRKPRRWKSCLARLLIGLLIAHLAVTVLDAKYFHGPCMDKLMKGNNRMIVYQKTTEQDLILRICLLYFSYNKTMYEFAGSSPVY